MAKLPGRHYRIAATDWKTDLTFGLGTGPGTPTNVSFQYRRVGDSMHVRIVYTSGTISSGQFITVQMPAGYTIDFTKITTATSAMLGSFAYSVTGGTQANKAVFTDGSSNAVFMNFLNAGSQTQMPKARYGTDLGSSGDTFMWDFVVPIVGWSSTDFIKLP